MLGFSDTCSLLLSKYSQGFIGSIHGPMVTGLFKEPEWSLERLRNLLFEGYVEDIRGIPLRGGKANHFCKRRLGLSQTIRKRTFLAEWFNAWILRYMFFITCLLYTSPSPRDSVGSRMPSSA